MAELNKRVRDRIEGMGEGWCAGTATWIDKNISDMSWIGDHVIEVTLLNLL